jgi:hypothetical protein
LDQLENYYALEGVELDTVRNKLTEDVISMADDMSEGELLRAAADFHVQDPAFCFDPCELPSGNVYQYHFIWCLYAIVWAIQQWDRTKGPDD